MKKKKLEDKLSRTRKKLSKAETKISELESVLQKISKPQSAASEVLERPPADSAKAAAKRQVNG